MSEVAGQGEEKGRQKVVRPLRHWHLLRREVMKWSVTLRDSHRN